MKIKIDKVAHFLGGYTVTITVGMVYDSLAGFVISCMVWGIKEAVDALGFGTPDRYDFIASVVGAAGALVFLIYIK